MVLSRSLVLDTDELFLGDKFGPSEKEEPLKVPAKGLRAVEKELILQTLKDAGGNRSQTARLLGISVRTLRNKLKEYGYTS